MSAIARQPSQRAAVQRMETLRALAIRWEISPTALLAARGAAILNGQAAKLRSCSLVIRIEREAAAAELDLTLTGGERSTITLVAGAPLSRLSESSFECIQASGLIDATLREGADGPQILYARTPLLERTLGLPGGVYDRPAMV